MDLFDQCKNFFSRTLVRVSNIFNICIISSVFIVLLVSPYLCIFAKCRLLSKLNLESKVVSFSEEIQNWNFHLVFLSKIPSESCRYFFSFSYKHYLVFMYGRLVKDVHPTKSIVFRFFFHLVLVQIVYLH